MLPKIARPEYIYEHKMAGKYVFHPMTLGSENVLLQLKDSSNVSEIVRGVTTVLKDCIVEPKNLDIGSLTMPKIEILFLKIAAKSSGEVRDLQYTCKAGVKKDEDSPETPCNKEIKVQLDLDQINIQVGEGYTDTFKIDDKMGFKLRLLSLEEGSKVEDGISNNDLIALHLDMVYDDSDKVWQRGVDFDDEAAKAFVASMSSKVREEVTSKFFTKMPAVRHTLKMKCPSCGADHSIELEGLESFFE